MSYSAVPEHRSMIFDGLRNAAYARAMSRVIKPGTRVMDLGAGLGVHGLNAARLGAAVVHLVEPESVLELARKVAQGNGLQDVHFHQCRVQELRLDQQVDVIVSVFTGNFLLTEDLLPSLFYARDNFLAPGGSLIPDRARMEVIPVMAEQYYREHIEAWTHSPSHTAQEQGLDYSVVRSFAANSMYYDTRDRLQATPLAKPGVLMELDFSTAESADCNSTVEVEVFEEATCHGWLGWFQMHLIDEWFSTSGEPYATHWSPVFMPLDIPIQVIKGDRLGFGLKRPEFGEWTWTTDHAGLRQRQSTFLSQPISLARMKKLSDNYQPVLHVRGEVACWLLTRMNGDKPVVELARDICARWPQEFVDYSEALVFVKALAERYS